MPPGRRPRPAELQRKLGRTNHHARKPPPAATIAPVVDITTARTPEIPEPLFPLGIRGRTIWDQILTGPAAAWIADSDLPMLQRLCELEDDAAALRYQILDTKPMANRWRARVALDAMGKQLKRYYAEFALTPAERSRLGVAIVHAQADMMRAQRPTSTPKTYTDPTTARSAPAPQSSQGPPYRSWTKPRIAAWCKDHGIDYPPSATKQELLTAALSRTGA